MQAHVGFVAERFSVAVIGLEGRSGWVRDQIEMVLRRAEVATSPPIVKGFTISLSEDAVIGSADETENVPFFDDRKHVVIQMAANALAALGFQVCNLAGEPFFK